MRLKVIFSILISFLIFSCQSKKKTNFIPDLISSQLDNIIGDACDNDNDFNSTKDKIIVIVDEQFDLKGPKFKDEYEDFDMNDFLDNSEEYFYDLRNIPTINGVSIKFIKQSELPNLKGGQGFGESIHMDYPNEIYEKYCKALLIFKPRIRRVGTLKTQILLKAIKYYEYPITKYTYLIELNGKNYSYKRLKEKRGDLIFR